MILPDAVNLPKAAKRVAVLSQSSAGVFVYTRWGIDVLVALDPAKMPGQFAQSWAYEVARTERKRSIAARGLGPPLGSGRSFHRALR